jgi:hypothetical protein
MAENNMRPVASKPAKKTAATKATTTNAVIIVRGTPP